MGVYPPALIVYTEMHFLSRALQPKVYFFVHRQRFRGNEIITPKIGAPIYATPVAAATLSQDRSVIAPVVPVLPALLGLLRLAYRLGEILPWSYASLFASLRVGQQ